MIAILEKRRRDDDGFALLFVLFVTTIVLIGVTAVLTVVTPNISAARRGQDVPAALAAARSGVDDVVAYLVSIPSCRSESRICPAALGAGTDALRQAGKARPTSLGNGQTFAWTTNAAATADGFVRVTSTGTAGGVTRKLIADLALRPSILAYGYYTDYEALSPEFLTAFFKPRSIYLDDASTCSAVGASCSATSGKYINWKGPTNPSVCGQHWYADGTTPGRAAAVAANGDPPVTETGTYGTTTSLTAGSAISRKLGCDLVFSSAMVQNGKTFTRDAILSTGSGPRFNQPVYTMWGYNDGTKNYTNPAFPAAGQRYRITNGTAMSNSPNLPQVAQDDLVLPKSIGTDGIPENACVFTGPTRVKLNGNGTATVTSPLTRTKNATSDSGCYPSNVSAGVVGWTFNYKTNGAGAIVTRSIGTAPSDGWAANPTRSSQTPSAGNEVFYFNAPGSTDVATHPDTSTAPYTGCSSTVKYSSSLTSTCAWTNVATTTDSTSTTGWTSYSNAACNAPPAATNRQLFECEYAKDTSATQRTVSLAGGQYKTVRDLVISDLAGNTCAPGTASAQAACVDAIVENRLTPANSTNLTTNGAHRYIATPTAGTPVTTTTAGATGVGPDGTTNDTFFTQPSPAKETDTRNQVTVTVKRQVYNSSSSTWGSDVPAFTFTTTLHDYTYTASKGMTYFPDENDVTPYNVGSTSGGALRGTGVTPQTGDKQPGDLYVDGANKGKLSLVADNDVIVTGNITNPANYTADTDAVSIAAGQDVRNYHPVACVEQNADDINKTATGWCPNDVTGATTSSTLTRDKYTNLAAIGDRVVQAAVFALSGSFGTDNYTRGAPVGDINIQGGLYQSHRGGNGVVSGNTEISGTTLQYTYVDLQRAELPYVPPSTSGNDVRPWNVVSISNG